MPLKGISTDFAAKDRNDASGEDQYSLGGQVHLWAHLCLYPLEALLAQEDLVALEAQVVLLVPDLPVWQNNTFQHHYGVILLDPLRLEPRQLNDNEEESSEMIWWVAMGCLHSKHGGEFLLLKLTYDNKDGAVICFDL